MEFRGGEAPMEFEWQGSGPMDPNSPFIMNSQKKRPFSTFTSPSKPAPPQLREPNSQPFFFSSNVSSVPQTQQYRAPSFTTPRKPFDVDFSSPPDESSPAEAVDDENTPEARPAAIDYGKTSNKRNSLFNMYGRFAPPRSAKKYSEGIARRLHKKRRRAQQFEQQLVRLSSDDQSDEDDEKPSAKGKATAAPPQQIGWMTSLFTFIHAYPEAPSIIAKYLQVFFNAVIIAGFLYVAYSFYAAIQSDVNRAGEEAAAEILSEMAACSKDYIDNRCGADNRLPALETVCRNWELCMNRDPNAVRRARLSAQTFAEIFNGFVEPITLKTFSFTCTIVVLGLLVNNATFTLFRRSQEQHIDSRRQPSNHYLHPTNQAAAIGQFAASPGLPYGQAQGMSWAGTVDDFGQQKMLRYERSPSKEYRGRSRSPEKRVAY